MRTPMPIARGDMASGVVDGLIVVVGGEVDPDSDSGVFPQAQAYDPARDEWIALPNLPVPRHGTGGAVHEGKLYVPGGADTQLFAPVATFEALSFRD